MAKRRKAARKRKPARRSRRESEMVNTFWVATIAAAVAIALIANYLTNQTRKASIEPSPVVTIAPV